MYYFYRQNSFNPSMKFVYKSGLINIFTLGKEEAIFSDVKRDVNLGGTETL